MFSTKGKTMSDGMTEVARDHERETAEHELYAELLGCVEHPTRDLTQLLALATAVDRVRGGMIGITNWSLTIRDIRWRLIRADETEWARTLAYASTYPHVRTKRGVISLYDRFKCISPFSEHMIAFGLRNMDEFGGLAYRALAVAGYDPNADTFMYVFGVEGERLVCRPIWVKQNVFEVDVPPRTGPVIAEQGLLI